MTLAIRSTDTQGTKSAPQYSLHAATEILVQARAAAQSPNYAGDLTPQQAWALFSAGVAELVDVRTHRELKHVGRVPGTKHVEWLRDEDMQKNPHFLTELGGKVGKEDAVLLLCRSGKRSVAAAESATRAGFRNAFNVLEGFEGDGNPERGWLNHDLPIADAQN